MKKFIFLLLMMFLLAGCGATKAPAATGTTMPVTAVGEEAAALAEGAQPPAGVILEPVASGILEERSNVAVVDYSNTKDGYIMIRYFGKTNQRLKVLLKGPTTTYNYNLPQGQWIVLPLSDGDGVYQAGIYRNIKGTEYAIVMMAEFPVALEDGFAPFLRPNQYVNYSIAPDTVALGAEICAGLTQPLDKVAAIYDYVVQNFSYDEEKAATVQSGYLPDLDEILKLKTGICFDYAAVMTAMLRSQQVPCKLVVGYAGSIYHAWISVWTEDAGWIDGAIFFNGQTWKRMDPTFVSSAEDRQEILDFVEKGNYVVKYLY